MTGFFTFSPWMNTQTRSGEISQTPRAMSDTPPRNMTAIPDAPRKKRSTEVHHEHHQHDDGVFVVLDFGSDHVGDTEYLQRQQEYLEKMAEEESGLKTPPVKAPLTKAPSIMKKRRFQEV
jgi:hypothetical protein